MDNNINHYVMCWVYNRGRHREAQTQVAPRRIVL